MNYDDQNVFARILRGEISCEKVAETQHALAFRDIHPQARVHVLVIPKGAYVDMDDFTKRAPPGEIADFFLVVGKVARDLGLAKTGYRLIANSGRDSRQEVPHFHVHLLGGQDVGRLVEASVKPLA